MATRRRQQKAAPATQAGRWLPPLAIALVLLIVLYGGESGLIQAPFTSGPADPSQVATVTTDVLNVRSGPSTIEPVVAVVVEGEQLAVRGEPVNGFVPVRYGATVGWSSGEYLAMPGADQASAPGGPAVHAASELEPSELEPATRESAHEVVVDLDTEPEMPADRWIEIDRSDATLTLWEGDRVVDVFSGRIGHDSSTDGFYSTAVGSYRVYDMHKGLSPTPFAEDTYLTDWVGFDPERKNGIHSPVREQDGTEREWQNPTTLGCVRLGADDAVAVFTFAEIGMRVEVVE